MHCSSQIRTPKAVRSAPSSRALVCSGGGSGAKPCPNFFRNFCTTPGKMDSRGCNGMYYATMLCFIMGSIDNQEVSNKWRNDDKPLSLSIFECHIITIYNYNYRLLLLTIMNHRFTIYQPIVITNWAYQLGL